MASSSSDSDFERCFSCHGLAEGGIESDGPLYVCCDCGYCPTCEDDQGIFDQVTLSVQCLGCDRVRKIHPYVQSSSGSANEEEQVANDDEEEEECRTLHKKSKCDNDA